jgi:formylglycine-generating enzyme required for sulfatase activity
VHRVCVKGFYLGKYEVTQAQYQQVMGKNPSNFEGANNPVEEVSWDDTQNFIEEISYTTSNKLRLPSEAEWEYACRAGGQHETYCGGGGRVDRFAWYDENSGKTTHPVGQLAANGFGLYDMSGNVWEWVQDWNHGNYNGAPTDGSAWEGSGSSRVLRGGSWYRIPHLSRAAFRNFDSPAFRGYGIGFRLARTLP